MEDEEMQNECFEEVAAINSEIRFMTLELMKISSQRNTPFQQTLREFIDNTNMLKMAFANAENQLDKPAKKKGKVS